MRREHARDTVGSPRTQQQSPRAPYTLHLGRVPCPPCGHALPPMQRVPSPRTRPRPSPSRLDPSSEHVASEKRANGQRRGSPRGAHPCLPPDAAHQKAHGRPSPHATSALPVHSAPSRLAEEPSSEHVASEKLANGQRRGSPRGLTHAPRPTLPIERHTDAPPPHARSALPGCSAPRLGSSRSPQALERACCLGKNVPVANVAAHPGGSPMPPARRCPSKGTRMPLPPMQRVPSPGTRPRPGSSRSPRASVCCLRKEPDASSPCLYRSYEGFTRCSRVLVRSRLRTSRGSTRDAVS